MTPAALSAIVLSFTRESGGAADKLGYNGRPRPPAPSLPRSLSGITGTYFIEAISGGPGGAVSGAGGGDWIRKGSNSCETDAAWRGSKPLVSTIDRDGR